MKKNTISFVSSIPVFSAYIAKGMGVGLLIFIGIFVLIAAGSIANGGTFESLTPDIYFALGFVGLIFFFTYVVMWIMFPHGFIYRVAIDDEGISQVSLSATKAVSRAAIIGGILRGSPGAVGTGLLAEAGESRHLSWSEIHIVKINASNRYCYFSKGKLGLFPIGFTCPEKYFEKVKSAVKEYTKT